MHIYNEIKNGNISIEKIEEDQKQFKSKLNEITIGNRKIIKKLITIKEIKNLFNSRDKVIKLYNDKVMLKLQLKLCIKNMEGAGFKILTPKQMLQRLPIVLPQVKAGNNSENLLNEIRKIVYSLYQSKQITNKVCNSIIKSMQL